MSKSLREAMDEARIGRLQWTMAVLLGVVMVLDGLDLQLASFSAPLLMADWHLSKPQFAPLLTAALIGMATGSLIGSWAGDRYGRKPTLVASVAFFGAMTAVCAGATGPKVFVLYRLLGGLGFGAAFPIAVTLMSEWMPPRAAGRAISIMTLGIPVGVMTGALAASWFLPLFGWRIFFAGNGLLCILFAGFLLWRLRESPSFLILRRRYEEAYAQLSRAWKRPVAGGPDLFRLEPARESGRGLLKKGNARVNVGLWLGVFCSSAMTYGISGWITVILSGLRLPLGTALRGPLAFSTPAIVGALVVGWMLLRLGSRATMLVLSLLVLVSAAAMSVAAFALVPGPQLFTTLFAGLALSGFGIGALQAAFYVVATGAYDTSIRTSGVGVVSMMGRIGAISSSFAGGTVLSVAHVGGFFALITMLAAAALGAIFVIQRHIPRLGPSGVGRPEPLAARLIPAGKK